MGGQTTGLGEANPEGYGGAETREAGEESAATQRENSGYGGDKDMDRTIGA